MKRLSFFDKIVFLINTILALLTVITFFVPNVPVAVMPAVSALSIAVPALVLLNVVFIVYWLLRKKTPFLMSSILLVGWYFLQDPFYKVSKTTNGNDTGALSVMSFNVRGFNKYEWIDSPDVDKEIVSLVKKKSPDILCFQEFSRIKKEEFKEYGYMYETPFYNRRTIQIFFSKYPIVSGGSLDFPNSTNNALYIDVLFKKDTIRVYNVHLQSFGIVPEIDVIREEESSKLVARSKSAMLKQYEQAKLIRKSMAQNRFRKIVVGDFNNTQYSNVYQIIKGDLKDSFLEKGKGFGRTYDLFGFPMRIDYILTDSRLKVMDHINFDQKLSDHYPVMATLRAN